MHRSIPPEVIERIARNIDDEKSACDFAKTCRSIHAAVTGDQWQWQQRYKRCFPLGSERELGWLRMRLRAHAFMRATPPDDCHHRAGPVDYSTLASCSNWFDIFCRRAMIGIRWRQAQFLVHPPTKPTKHLKPDGVRVQSLAARHYGSKRSMAIFSQYLTAVDQPPVWIEERVGWSDLPTGFISSIMCSDSHIAIGFSCLDGLILNVWNLDSLSSPPCRIYGNSHADAQLYGKWMCTTWENTLNVHDLDGDMLYECTLDAPAHRTIMQCMTSSSIHLFILTETHVGSHTTIAWCLYKCTAADDTRIHAVRRGSLKIAPVTDNYQLMAARIDDASVLIYRTTYLTDLNDADSDLPTVVLLNTIEPSIADGILWSACFPVCGCHPLLHHRLLAIFHRGMYGEHTYSLLDLANGRVVRRVTSDELGAWYSVNGSEKWAGLSMHSGGLARADIRGGFYMVDLREPGRTYAWHNTWFKERFWVVGITVDSALMSGNKAHCIMDYSYSCATANARLDGQPSQQTSLLARFARFIKLKGVAL
ncbi:hypothetical protein THASP1DRAFT_21745 [Thamnocephalis sphaerospora]|uniref:F-box domain-containing protein n=1 Tax=Thamnocephalis sphaerospora TaxID=78915 RepID=A0A4P9XW95_9FUNG|nr:hypothetical protein THASP1DRAFT_21745 [Thamnocephalis sphaerospora]|eukprot:RKP10586.1 hypothetical protein THASP1DRAFT_21745 [Thamnocephalis sphaerospora]